MLLYDNVIKYPLRHSTVKWDITVQRQDKRLLHVLLKGDGLTGLLSSTIAISHMPF